MSALQQEQAYAAKLQRIANAVRNNGSTEARQLWNPKRPWTQDKYGGRKPDEKTLCCRQAIIETLRKQGPLSANQIYKQTPGYGDRRHRNAKDWLVTAGLIIPLVEEDRKIRRYALPLENPK